MRFKTFLKKELLSEEDHVGKLHRVHRLDEMGNPYDDHSDLADEPNWLPDEEYNRISRYVRREYPGYVLSGLGPGDGFVNAQIMPKSGRGGYINLKVKFNGNKMDVREGTLLKGLLLQEGTELTPELATKIAAIVHKWGNDQIDYDDMPPWIHDLMYEAFHTEMPYGTQTGDTGTADEWYYDVGPEEIAEQFEAWLKRNIGHKIWHSNQHSMNWARDKRQPHEL